MSVNNLVILGQWVIEIFEELFSRRTNEHGEAYPNSAKRLKKRMNKVLSEALIDFRRWTGYELDQGAV